MVWCQGCNAYAADRYNHDCDAVIERRLTLAASGPARHDVRVEQKRQWDAAVRRHMAGVR